MGILEELLNLGKKFLSEQKKTNELLEILINQNSTKNDFIIKGQKEAFNPFIDSFAFSKIVKSLNISCLLAFKK